MTKLDSILNSVECTLKVYPDYPTKGLSYTDLFSIVNVDTQALIENWVASNCTSFVFVPDSSAWLFLSEVIRSGKRFVPVTRKGHFARPNRLHFTVDSQFNKGSKHYELTIPNVKGKRVTIFNDVLATGSTVHALASVLESFEPKSINFVFILELSNYNGRQLLLDTYTDSVCTSLIKV